MKKIVYAMIVLAGMAFTSCSTLTKTSTTTSIDTSVKQFPTVADLDVKAEKVSATTSWNFVPFHIGEPSLSSAKANLIADVVKKHNADVLVEPQFVYEFNRYSTRVLTVTGYPATYKNFRKATAEDIKAIKDCGQPSETKVYKSKKKGGFFGLFNIF